MRFIVVFCVTSRDFLAVARQISYIMEGMAVEKEIFVFGIRRSGNHALIQWLLGVLSQRIPDARGQCVVSGMFVNQQPLPIPEGTLRTPPGDVQIVSFEDQASMLADPGLLDPTGRSCEKRPIVILRDPYNWMASLRVYHPLWQGSEEKFDWYIGLWVSYAENFFAKERKDIFPLKFCEFRRSEDKRRQLAGYVGEPFTDRGLNWIEGPAKGGPGSSFDWASYEGKAQEMDLDGRWRHLDDACKKKFDSFPKLRELSGQIFGFNPF